MISVHTSVSESEVAAEMANDVEFGMDVLAALVETTSAEKLATGAGTRAHGEVAAYLRELADAIDAEMAE